MKSAPPKTAFELQGEIVPLDKLLPTRPVRKDSTKYQAMLASVREVGIVEPVSVFRQKHGKHLIVDGHVRVEALRELGVTEVFCLFATSDEGFTYNTQVSRVAPIQAARMILKALDAGVPAERIAKALNLSIQTVLKNRNVLEGLCVEAVDLLKDKDMAQQSLALLKKAKPIRQIEIAELMVSSGNYSVSYARGLVMTSKPEDLIDPEAPKKIPGAKPEDFSRIEHEIRVHEKDFRMLDETYNENVMALTLTRTYVRRLLDNGKIVRYLGQHFGEFLKEFQRIVESNALDG